MTLKTIIVPLYFAVFFLSACTPTFSDEPPCVKLMRDHAYKLAKDQPPIAWDKFLTPQQRQACPITEGFLMFLYLIGPQQKNIPTSMLLNFITTHPTWPKRETLIKRLEKEGTATPENADSLIKIFEENPPQDGPGIILYAKALYAAKKVIAGNAVAREGWRHGRFTPPVEAQFLQKFSHLLTRDDHIQRADTLLWRQNYDAAGKLLPVLPPYYKDLVHAHKQLITNDPKALEAIADAQKHAKDHDPLTFHHLKWHRLRKDDDQATKLANKLKNPSKFHDSVWKEKHILARRAFEVKNYKKAYALSAQHGIIVEEGPLYLELRTSYSQAEWLAGWIMFRFLKNPAQALPHFERAYSHVSNPMSVAKLAYWCGRAHEALGQVKKSQQWYILASQYPTTYYGQLSADELGLGPDHFQFKSPPITANDKRVIDAKSATHVMQLIQTIPSLHHWLRPFALTLAKDAVTPGQQRYVLQLLSKLDPDSIVYASRIMAETHKQGVHYKEAFPYKFVEHFHKDIDPALALGIIIRESAFETHTQSLANARGLMQIILPTAQATAKNHNLPPPSPSKLLDPSVNAQIGTAHLVDLMMKYQGLYPFVLSAYNAGPHRVPEWITLMGDPREGEIDWVDWIESIPFYETRNYVMRVMENMRIYKENYA